MAARRMGIICILLCICLCLLPQGAAAVSTSDAAGPLNPEGKCFLTLSYGCDGKTFSGIPVTAYRIADVSADAQYALTEPFLSSGLTLNGIRSAGEWDAVRTTLEAYILANTVAPDLNAVTDQSGRVQFDGLKPGLYFVSSAAAESDGWQYAFGSALIALPGLGTDGLWQYRVAVTPKPEILPPVTPDEELELQVLKLWKDKNYTNQRPDSIAVEIFRNGESYETVMLSESNHWSYSWRAPADGARWLVVERQVPEGYAVTVEERGTSFLLTNTYLAKDVPADSPRTADTSRIQLYVLLLWGSGMSLILLGMARKRKRP